LVADVLPTKHESITPPWIVGTVQRELGGAGSFKGGFGLAEKEAGDVGRR
jgi:hypothetical protein